MSLRAAPLLYVFYEASSLPRQRELFEDVLGLPVIENQFHPPHEYHGLVKYDAGQVILSLNLTTTGKFRRRASDGLVTALSGDRDSILERLSSHGYDPPAKPIDLFTDSYGHHYLFEDSETPSPVVRELALTVNELSSSIPFYREVLGLELLQRSGNEAVFATGTVDLRLRSGLTAPDRRPLRHNSYLLVFHTPEILQTRDALVERGLDRTPLVGRSDIGHTARITDPSGHVHCLYQPSEESLTWGSGPKVLEILNGSRARRPILSEVAEPC